MLLDWKELEPGMYILRQHKPQPTAELRSRQKEGRSSVGQDLGTKVLEGLEGTRLSTMPVRCMWSTTVMERGTESGGKQ